MSQKVELAEMLAARERRAFLQKFLREKYFSTVISFSLNIPGEIKTSPKIRRLFDAGLGEILSRLAALKIDVLDKIELHEKTGDEIILATSGNAQEIKEAMTALEESLPEHRLFDIDVIGADGEKISRKTARRCFLCERPAFECSRSRRHSVEELTAYVKNLLNDFAKTQADKL